MTDWSAVPYPPWWHERAARRDIELAANWLAQARRDLHSARILAGGERFELACFVCQQAAEKSLTACVIALAGDRPRTHDLGALVAQLARHRPDAREALAEVAALDPYYVTTRYPDAVGGGVPGEKFFAAESSLAIDRADRAIEFAWTIVRSEVDAPKA